MVGRSGTRLAWRSSGPTWASPSTSPASARLAKAQAEAQERKNLEASRDLVPAGELEAALLGVTSPIAAALDGFPTRAAPVVFGAKSVAETEERIRAEMYQVRTELADYGKRFSEKFNRPARPRRAEAS